nr:atherin-like [Loxodonta africana]
MHANACPRGGTPASRTPTPPGRRPSRPRRRPALPPFLLSRSAAPPSPLTYLVAESEERHGGGRRAHSSLRRRPGPPLPRRWPQQLPGAAGRRPAELRSPRAGGNRLPGRPPPQRGEEPGRSRLLLLRTPRPLPSFLSLFLGRLHTLPERPPQPLPPPPPHAPFPKYPVSPRGSAAPARGSSGIQTPHHSITTTARRDWPPRGGEARES